MIFCAFPHRQFHTLPSLLDSWAALPNSNPNACMPMHGGSLYHFYDGLWYDPAERRTHDLPCERRTRYRLSQPDTVECQNGSQCCEKFHFSLSPNKLQIKFYSNSSASDFGKLNHLLITTSFNLIYLSKGYFITFMNDDYIEEWSIVILCWRFFFFRALLSYQMRMWANSEMRASTRLPRTAPWKRRTPQGRWRHHTVKNW